MRNIKLIYNILSILGIFTISCSFEYVPVFQPLAATPIAHYEKHLDLPQSLTDGELFTPLPSMVQLNIKPPSHALSQRPFDASRVIGICLEYYYSIHYHPEATRIISMYALEYLFHSQLQELPQSYQPGYWNLGNIISIAQKSYPITVLYENLCVPNPCIAAEYQWNLGRAVLIEYTPRKTVIENIINHAFFNVTDPKQQQTLQKIKQYLGKYQTPIIVSMAALGLPFHENSDPVGRSRKIQQWVWQRITMDPFSILLHTTLYQKRLCISPMAPREIYDIPWELMLLTGYDDQSRMFQVMNQRSLQETSRVHSWIPYTHILNHASEILAILAPTQDEKVRQKKRKSSQKDEKVRQEKRKPSQKNEKVRKKKRKSSQKDEKSHQKKRKLSQEKETVQEPSLKFINVKIDKDAPSRDERRQVSKIV